MIAHNTGLALFIAGGIGAVFGWTLCSVWINYCLVRTRYRLRQMRKDADGEGPSWDL
jgi:hypothetical protein